MTSISVLRRHTIIQLLGVISLATIPTLTSHSQVLGMAIRSSSARTADASNLRQIMQASLIYAQDHHDQLPQATDVWDYARILAHEEILDSAAMWQSRADPATPPDFDRNTKVIGASRQLNPAFRELKSCWAVALGKLDATMPATTPIAWTRGLQSNGTWASHSPYGEDGGYIVFLGGNVTFYRNLTADGGELVRFDGKGETANILDALPPGTLIGEYEPTEADKANWARINIKRINSEKWRRRIPLMIASIVWLYAVVTGICLCIKKRIGIVTLVTSICLLTLGVSLFVPLI